MTSSGWRWPLSSSFPSPTARTLPFWGFSLAVSGRTRPDAVVSSSSTARTIRRSPRGFSFIASEPPLRFVGTLNRRVPATAGAFYDAAAHRQGPVGTLFTRVPKRRWGHDPFKAGAVRADHQHTMRTIGFRSNILFAIAA